MEIWNKDFLYAKSKGYDDHESFLIAITNPERLGEKYYEIEYNWFGEPVVYILKNKVIDPRD